METELNHAFTTLYNSKDPSSKLKKMVDNLALEIMGETWVWPVPAIQHS